MYWEIGPSRDGPQDLVADVIQLVAIILAGVSYLIFLGIESKELNRRVVVTGLALGLVPYVLLFGIPGYVFNAGFLLAAVSGAIALWRFHSWGC